MSRGTTRWEWRTTHTVSAVLPYMGPAHEIRVHVVCPRVCVRMANVPRTCLLGSVPTAPSQ